MKASYLSHYLPIISIKFLRNIEFILLVLIYYHLRKAQLVVLMPLYDRYSIIQDPIYQSKAQKLHTGSKNRMDDNRSE